jgi:hypothetical protein
MCLWSFFTKNLIYLACKLLKSNLKLNRISRWHCVVILDSIKCAHKYVYFLNIYFRRNFHNATLSSIGVLSPQKLASRHADDINGGNVKLNRNH